MIWIHFQVLLIFLAYFGVLAESCILYPIQHNFFQPLDDSLEPQILKENREDLKIPLQTILAFQPDFTMQECSLANSLKEAYGEAEMNTAYFTSFESYEDNRVLKAVTYVALENMLRAPRPVMDAFYKYYSTLASIKHSFLFVCNEETKELIKLIGKSDNAQSILTVVERCVSGDVFFDHDAEIVTLCGDKAKEVIAIMNAMRKKCNQGIISKIDIHPHYKGIIQSALNEVKITDDDIESGFSYNFVFYMIFKILNTRNPEDAFELIFADKSILRKEELKKSLNIESVLNKAAGFFLTSAKKLLSPTLKEREKILESLERKAIYQIKEKVSLLSKQITRKPTESPIYKPTSSPPSSGDNLHNFLFFVPVCIIVIGVIIFLIVRRKRQKEGN
jgi:hypothetical protein